MSTKKYDRISCSYSDGSVFNSQANKCYSLQVFFDLSEPFYFYTKTTTVNKATILGQAIQVAQTPTLTMELLGTNHSFNYISEVYIMRTEPTALPEPLMWTGSGPSPLCQFFLLSSSFRVMPPYKLTLILLSFLSPFMSSDKFLTPALTVLNQ